MSRRDLKNRQGPETSEEDETDWREARPEEMPPPEVPLRFQMDLDREALRLISWPGMKGKMEGRHKTFRKTSKGKVVVKDRISSADRSD